jgi:hypothetical protein
MKWRKGKGKEGKNIKVERYPAKKGKKTRQKI